MEHGIPERMQEWVAALDIAALPVLPRLATELADLKAREDRVTTQHVADVVLHDPIMTVKVLHYLRQHRTRRQSQDITTIANALMMLGLSPFFAHSASGPRSPTVRGGGLALRALLCGARPARGAYARDWARLRRAVPRRSWLRAAPPLPRSWCGATLSWRRSAGRRRRPSLRRVRPVARAGLPAERPATELVRA
jgi:hypothetical protein